MARILLLGGRPNFALSQAQRMIEATAAELEPEDRERFLAISWHADIANATANDIWPSPPR